MTIAIMTIMIITSFSFSVQLLLGEVCLSWPSSWTSPPSWSSPLSQCQYATAPRRSLSPSCSPTPSTASCCPPSRQDCIIFLWNLHRCLPRSEKIVLFQPENPKALSVELETVALASLPGVARGDDVRSLARHLAFFYIENNLIIIFFSWIAQSSSS